VAQPGVGSEGWRREALGRLFNRFVQVALLPGISDSQCGAKAARRDVWRRIEELSREGFSWDMEAIAIARRLGIEVREVPVEWTYREGSRVRPLRDGLSMVRSVWAIRRRCRGPARPPT
jgi:dolichyl-phosphate beta-glucosyltransferase